MQTHFSFDFSIECAFFLLKALESHFQIRPSLIIAFQHYQYSHSQPCKCKLENKKCSNSCKKSCKCKKETIKKCYILGVYVASTSQNSQNCCPKWFPSKATTQTCIGKLHLAQENITTVPIPPRVHGSDLLCHRAFKHLQDCLLLVLRQ